MKVCQNPKNMMNHAIQRRNWEQNPGSPGEVCIREGREGKGKNERYRGKSSGAYEEEVNICPSRAGEKLPVSSNPTVHWAVRSNDHSFTRKPDDSATTDQPNDQPTIQSAPAECARCMMTDRQTDRSPVCTGIQVGQSERLAPKHFKLSGMCTRPLPYTHILALFTAPRIFPLLSSNSVA